MESYTFTPDDNFSKLGNLSNRPSQISYGEAMLKNFCVREVFIDGKPKGEYHVKIRQPRADRIQDMVIFLIQTLGGCEVGIIDPSNTLNLDYQIFIKTSDPMKMLSMMDTMSSVDSSLTNS